MPRPFPTSQELDPTKKGWWGRIRGWWSGLFPHRSPPVLGALPAATPVTVSPVSPHTIPPPAIVPVAIRDGEHSEVDHPWVGFLRARGASPPSANLEEVRSHLLAEILHETQSAHTPGDAAFLQRIAKVLVNADLHLPPFPSIARELDTLLFKGDPSVVEVTAVVERDPGLVREVWVRASGANFRRPPARLDEAIGRIGLTELWRVAMAMSMQSPVFRAGNFQKEAEHVHAHGMLCAEIAAHVAREPRGSAYLSGLLHDIGKLVIFRAAGGGKDKPNNMLVERMVQNHHSSIGMLAARSWNLGPEVEFAIGFHHHPPLAMLSKPGPLGPTAIAEAAAHIAEAERGRVLTAGGMPVPVFSDLPEELREAVLTAHRLLDVSDGKKVPTSAHPSGI